MRIAVTGGPSGGHAYPAVAFAEYLAADLGNYGIHLILPEKMLFHFNLSKQYPFQIHRVPGIGFNASKPWTFPEFAINGLRLMVEMSALLNRIRPDGIVCFGTFLTVIAARWARNHGVPVITHEQNVLLGRANQLALKWVDGLALGLPDTVPQGYFDKQLSVRVCGQVLRKQFRTAERPAARNEFYVLVLGGSQGSKQVNDTVFEAFSEMDEKVRRCLICMHIAGHNDREEARKFYQSNGIRHEVFDFCDSMEMLYENADFVIGRSGAGTMAECAAFGRPLIIIPFPSRHQEANAGYLAKWDAAMVIKSAKGAPKKLRYAIEFMCANPGERFRYARNLQTAVPLNGCENLANWIRELIEKEPVHA